MKSTNMSKFKMSDKIRATVILALLTGLAGSAQAQTLLYQWDFNGGPGTTVAPTVAVGGGGLTMNYNAVATDLYGASGSGVSGGAGDGAFANNNSTYGNAAASGIAISTSGNVNIGVQSAFTMTGWIKADGGFSAANQFARVFMIGQGTPDTGAANAATLAIFNNPASLNAPQANALQLRLSNITTGAPFGTDGALTGNDSLLPFGSGWMFFAVSVDLTTIANNVSFQLGTQSSLNAPITVSYSNAGAPIGSIDFGTTGSALLLNRANGQRAFDGFADDFRFYSGALNPAAVDAVRLAAVPEPSALAVLGLGTLGLAAFRRRRA